MMQARRTLAIVVLTTLVSCTGQFTPASPPAESVVLRINSTAATAPLVMTISRIYSESHPDVSFETVSGNHDQMVNRLLVGDMAYFVSNHLAAENNRSFWAAPLAQDGLAIIVNPDNPVTNLTTEQIRRIYRGFITNWQDVGGSDLPITLISREEGSGTRSEFERLVMGQQRVSPNAEKLPSTIAVMARITAQSGAIGYVPLSQGNETIRILAVEGILPSLTTVGNNSYPLRSTLYIIGLTEPEGAYRTLVGWVQGVEGQAAISTNYARLPE